MIRIRDDSPRWKEINASAWAHERAGLRQIKVLLPDADPYFAWANVEFLAPDSSINEVDLLVLTPSGLHLIELKHWQGEISGDGSRWRIRMPNGRTRSVDDPLILANRKAKRLASLLEHYNGQSGKRVKVPFIRAAIFLHAPGMRTHLDRIGRQWVYGLPGDARSGLPSILDLLTQQPTDQRDLVDRTRAREIVALIDGAGIRPSVADRTIGQLLLHPKPYAEGPGWQDYLAGHKIQTDLVYRVRFYLTSKASADDRDTIQRAAEREFRLLLGIHHPGIAHASDLVDHEFGPAVIFEHDSDAVRLDHWLAEHGDHLTLEQRLNLVRDLAEIIQYAHSRHLVHRGLNPRSILVCDPAKPRPRLVVIDWQTGGRVGTSTTQATLLGGTTHWDQLADDLSRLYQAPELATNPDAPGILLDVFALGALTYLIVTGQPPARTAAELTSTITAFGSLQLSAAADAIPTMLDYLVTDATMGNTADRTASVSQFLEHLDAVEDELTTPEPAAVIDPLEARGGEVLDGGLVVERRLGSGATATALLVRREGEDRPLVLKVARDEGKRQRLVNEADRIRGLKHWQVAQLVEGPVTVGRRSALLLEYAGEPTLAEELQSHGRLSLDLLERYGRDLLDIVAFLDGQGVTHRDIKPANLAARPRPKDKQPHLCIFDFSLAATPAEQIGAGTPPYLDPFLGPPRRARFDLAAERFTAAVALYEMATGTLPRWGDGIANPATIADEVTIRPELFDPAVADRLAAFFARALAREARARFDTIEEMADAWRLIFKDVAPAGPTGPSPAAPAQAVTRETPIDLVGLTARARSALERFGVRTAGELADYDAMALSRLEGVPQATKTEIRKRAKELRLHFAPAPTEETPGERERARGIDSLVELLVPRETARNRSEVAALRATLGLTPPPGTTTYLRWPTQSETAQASEITQPQLSRVMQRQVERWARDEDVAEVRDEIVALLDANGGVMSAAELAQELIGSRGTFAEEPRRTAQAIGLVRAAVEAELSRGGDARVGTRKFGSEMLVGREPDDPSATHSAQDLAGYAVQLARVARQLVDADPLPTPSRAIERLRHTTPPAAMPALPDTRLIQLAAAAAGDVAANAQLQLYPVGLAPERALRMAAGSLALTRNQTLTIEQLRARIAARFPQAAPLPGRPALDRLLTACGVLLEWDQQAKVYRPAVAMSGSLFATSTRVATVGALGTAGIDPAEDAQARLAAALERDAFLALLVNPSHLTAATNALLDRLALTEVDVTRILIDTLRSIGVPWQLIVDSDAQTAGAPDRRNLETAVRHEVAPRVVARYRCRARTGASHGGGAAGSVRLHGSDRPPRRQRGAAPGRPPAARPGPAANAGPGHRTDPGHLGGAVDVAAGSLVQQRREGKIVTQPVPLKALQRQLKLLVDDLREQSTAVPELDSWLHAQYDRAFGHRTGASFEEWREEQLDQAAVAWLLGTVFVRFCEDNDLASGVRLAGPDGRTEAAAQAQTAYFLKEPRHNDRHWILAAFSHLRELSATAGLFDAHNPVWRFPISGDAAADLLDFWRRGAGVHSFVDPALDTRFLGDLYQDLSEYARKRYALLQTPEFVEEFILDLTLTPSIAEYGLEETSVIDPTCGSGHFLLGAFARLHKLWKEKEPGTDPRVRVQKALDQVTGVDVNPFAVSIAKFRLLVAALQACRERSLETAPGFKLRLAAGDSLLRWGEDSSHQGDMLAPLEGREEYAYYTEDAALLAKYLERGQYTVAVGNPPYITVKDKILNQRYRELYATCSGTYALSVPFIERFFELVRRTDQSGRTGFVGQITANSFMKREFGKKLVEEYLAGAVELSHVIDASGADITGHSTATVILVGRRRSPKRQNLRAVMGIVGKRAEPGDPPGGPVWAAIVESVDKPGLPNPYISVTDMPRQRLTRHPWSLSGGGASEVAGAICSGSSKLAEKIEVPIGRAIRAGADDAFLRPLRASARFNVSREHLRQLLIGEVVRDWAAWPEEAMIYPYGEERQEEFETELWPWRTFLAERRTFQGNMADASLNWWEYMQHTPSAYRTPLSIVFAFVATHNHFVLDRGGKVFKQSAPVIKLRQGAGEDDHLALLGLLNSSTACVTGQVPVIR